MKRILALLATLYLYTPASSQAPQWAWIAGSNTVSQGPVYGTKGVPAPGNTPGARDGGNSCTDNNGNLWLFGGEGGWNSPFGAGFFNDLWKFDISSNQWTFVSGDIAFYPPGVSGPVGTPSVNYRPQGRTNPCSWIDKQGNFWVFGGSINQNTDRLNDLWRFNPSTGEWTLIGGSTTPNQPAVYGTKGVPSTSNIPAAMYRAQCWTDNNGIFWLFGGSTPAGTIGDLWRFNPATLEWTWVHGNHTVYVYLSTPPTYGAQGVASPANDPGPRIDATTWVDNNNNLWLFGAGPGVQLYNDLWKYDPLTDEWTWVNGDNTWLNTSVYGTKGVAAPTNKPGSRYGAAGFHTTDGKLWLFGGEGLSGNAGSSSIDVLNDLWSYDIASGQWTWMAGANTLAAQGVYGTQGVAAPGNQPGGRIWPMGWGDPYNRLWLFGGGGYASGRYEGSNNDLWGYMPSLKITFVGLSATAFCAGSSVDITFATLNFPTDNIFTAQLSDVTGSWANPVNIGTLAGSTGGIINATIPANTPSGTGYRIRVISQSTGIMSPDNGVDLTVYGKPTLTITPGANPNNICPGAGIGLVAGAMGGNPPYVYNWSTGSAGPSVTVTPLADTTLYVTVSDGCTAAAATDSVHMTVYTQQFQLTGNPVLCPDAGETLNAHSGYTSYLWQDGSTDSTLTISQPGVYSVGVTDPCGKAWSGMITVIPDHPPTGFLPPDTAICSYADLPITPDGVYPKYQWSTGETSRSITVSAPGLYWLQITDKAGCSSADTIVVSDKDCFMGFRMPAAFTPNGDGHNDRLRPLIFGRLVHMHFTIFNRYGGKVFETTDPAQGWDGNDFSGNKATGVYVWACEYQFAGDTPQFQKGTVIVIR